MRTINAVFLTALFGALCYFGRATNSVQKVRNLVEKVIGVRRFRKINFEVGWRYFLCRSMPRAYSYAFLQEKF